MKRTPGPRPTGVGTALVVCLIGSGALLPASVFGQVTATWEVADVPQVTLGDGAEYFQSVAHASLRADGSVLVADGGLLNVRAFAPDGRLLWSAGRSGEGPGEYRMIHGLWLTQQRGIGVWDGRLRRITYLTRDGRVADTKRAHIPTSADLGGNLEVLLGVLPDEGILLAELWMGDPKAATAGRPASDVWRVGRFTGDGSFEHMVMRLQGMRRMPQVLPFSPIPYVGTWGDTIFSIDDAGSALTVRDGTGRTLRVLELGVRGEAGTDPEGALRRELERRGRELFLNNLSELGRAATTGGIPRIGGLLVDSRGLLWVKAYAGPHDSVYLKARALRPAGGGRWSVHRRDGTRVATVAMPDRFTPLQVSGESVLGVAVDDFGVERVMVYRLDRR